MPLQKQVFNIPLAQSLDTASDSKSVIPTKATTLQNWDLDGSNTLRMRPGYSRQTAASSGRAYDPAGGDYTGGTPTTFSRLYALGSELLAETDVGLLAYHPTSTTNSAWVSRNGPNFNTTFNANGRRDFERGKATWRTAAEKRGSAINLSQTISQYDVARDTTTGLECWVWTEESSSGSARAYYRIIDSSTGEQVQGGPLNITLTSSFNPRVILKTSGTPTFYIYYVGQSGGTYTVRMVSVALNTTTNMPGTPAASVTVKTLGSDGVFDAYYYATGNTIALAIGDTSDDLIIYSLDGADGSTTLWTSATYACTLKSVSVVMTATTRVLAVFDDNNTSIRSAVGSTGAISTTLLATEACRRVALGLRNSSSEPHMATWDGPSSTIRIATLNDTTGAAVSAATTFARGCRLAGRPVAYKTDDQNYGVYALPVELCISTSYAPSSLQPTLYLLKLSSFDVSTYYGNLPPRVLARLYPGKASNLGLTSTSNDRMASTLYLSATSEVLVAATIPGAPNDLRGGAVGALSTQIGAWSYLPGELETVRYAEDLFLPGACPNMYDGGTVFEAGFHYYPEITSVTQVVGGGSLSAGTYGIIAVYEWTDRNGRVHRSAPSVASSIAVSANDRIDVVVPTLRLTDRIDQTLQTQNPVRIVIYRTVANGTLYYHDIGDSFSDAYNVVTSDTVTVRLSQSDTSIATERLLYTTGGGVEAEAFPACGAVCRHQNRLFMADAVDRRVIWYTDELDTDDIASITNEVYRLFVPPEIGDVTGVASFNDRLIVFGTKRLGLMYGSGPNRAGLQNQYSDIQIIAGSTGLPDGYQTSIAVLPDGIWFLSTQKALRFLNASFALEVDQELQGLSGIAVRSFFATMPTYCRAVLFPNTTKVGFSISTSGKMLVYDFERKFWGTYTNFYASGGITTTDSDLWFIASSGATVPMKLGAVGDFDNEVFESSVVETGWIDLAGQQGYQRLYEVMVLAQCMTSGTYLQLEVGYDYSSSYAETATFIGDSSLAFQPRLRVGKQKCEAVRFRVSTLNLDELITSGETFRLTSFAVRVGVKGSLAKRGNSGGST